MKSSYDSYVCKLKNNNSNKNNYSICSDNVNYLKEEKLVNESLFMVKSSMKLRWIILLLVCLTQVSFS